MPTFERDDAALAVWQAPHWTVPGGQPRHAVVAVELVSAVRLVFHLARHQAKVFACCTIHVFGLAAEKPPGHNPAQLGRSLA